MFRAGHAHAGVLVIFSLIAEILTDQASLVSGAGWLVRVGFPLAAILVSGGFFAAASGKGLTRPNGMIVILYVGIGLLIVIYSSSWYRIDFFPLAAKCQGMVSGHFPAN